MSTHVLNGAFYSLGFDVPSALAPMSRLVTTSLVLLARKTIPAKDLPELITWLKANPNSASVGIAAVTFRPCG
jgi:tripartite-type tricarboxylate transporter receptor subunit TctC